MDDRVVIGDGVERAFNRRDPILDVADLLLEEEREHLPQPGGDRRLCVAHSLVCRVRGLQSAAGIASAASHVAECTDSFEDLAMLRLPNTTITLAERQSRQYKGQGNADGAANY
jgi:hypothetical protein